MTSLNKVVMKISHEVPFQLLNESIHFNDYDYCLVHLLDNHKVYRDFFTRSLESGREVLLDNSMYELESPFPWDAYYKWACKLRPNYVIIPDVFDNLEFSVSSVLNYAPILRNEGLKSIGVLQGSSFDELCECYLRIEPFVDCIAISFGYPAYNRIFSNLDIDHSRMYGRILLINKLIDMGLVNTHKRHHLLGCALPQELKFYQDEKYHFLQSIDTSSPIVSAIEKKKYDVFGLHTKPKSKLADLIDMDIDSHTLSVMMHNIDLFRSFLIK